MIFEYEKISGKITASLLIDGSTQVYGCIPTVCSNPFCECDEVFLELKHADETHKLGINLKERQLIERKNVVTIEEFALQLFKQLDDSDFIILGQVYWRYKYIATKNADYSQLKVEFSRDEIERQNLMLVYTQILPFDEQLNVVIAGVNYVIEDNYCVRNKCSSKEVVLGFYPVLEQDVNKPDAIESVKQELFIRVDYQAKTWVVNDEPGIDSSQFRTELESKYDNFYALLQQRHQRLKLLYSNYIKTLTFKNLQKVGRNEPCPCGSGKKYKKCCGASGMLSA